MHALVTAHRISGAIATNVESGIAPLPFAAPTAARSPTSLPDPSRSDAGANAMRDRTRFPHASPSGCVLPRKKFAQFCANRLVRRRNGSPFVQSVKRRQTAHRVVVLARRRAAATFVMARHARVALMRNAFIYVLWLSRVACMRVRWTNFVHAVVARCGAMRQDDRERGVEKICFRLLTCRKTVIRFRPADVSCGIE
ncbi:hypothetical protein [Lysobacter fragariae]